KIAGKTGDFVVSRLHLKHLGLLRWPPGEDRTAGFDTLVLGLAGLANLEELTLQHTLVTDEGLLSISGPTSLNRLYLDDTAITDKSIPHLAKLHELRWITLSGTAVTGTGVKTLEHRLPKVRTDRGPPRPERVDSNQWH